MLEASCPCGETFNPNDETDVVHGVREDGTPCGQVGVITGEWLLLTRRSEPMNLHDDHGDLSGFYYDDQQDAAVHVPRTPIIGLLDQDEIWQPAGSTPVKLTDMDESHLRNLLGWLERNASRLELAWSLNMILGDPPDDVVDGFEHAAANPVTWLRARPLYRAVVRILEPVTLTVGLTAYEVATLRRLVSTARRVAQKNRHNPTQTRRLVTLRNVERKLTT